MLSKIVYLFFSCNAAAGERLSGTFWSSINCIKVKINIFYTYVYYKYTVQYSVHSSGTPAGVLVAMQMQQHHQMRSIAI